MAVLEGGTSAVLAGVGNEAAKALHVTGKPLPAGSGGHYRCSTRTRLVNTQAANSRLFEIRNPSATLLFVLLKLHIQWFTLATDAHTATIEDSLDIYKATSFSVVDPTGSPITPLTTKARTSDPSSVVEVRANALAGLAAGITGGTLTLEASPYAQLGKALLAAPVATAVPPPKDELLLIPELGDAQHPMVFAQNEGLVVANRVLLGAAAASSVYINAQWAEVSNF